MKTLTPLGLRFKNKPVSKKSKTFILIISLIFLLAYLGVNTDSKAQEISPRFQSVFIFGVSKSINWSSNNAQFKIALVGNDKKLLAELKSLASSKQMNGKQVQIQSYTSLPASFAHDIVFVSGSSASILREVLSKSGKNTMVMTAYGNALSDGSHLNFFMNGNKISFELNKTGLENKTNLRVTDTLVKLAASVQ